MNENSVEFPYIGFHLYFDKDDGRNVEKPRTFYAKCKICSPSKKSLSVSTLTSYNLKNHIMVSVYFCFFPLSCVFSY